MLQAKHPDVGFNSRTRHYLLSVFARDVRFHLAIPRPDSNIETCKRVFCVVPRSELPDLCELAETGEGVKVIAREDIRYQTLLKGLISVTDLSETEVKILELAAKGRYEGVSQPSVTRTLNLDSRSLIYYTRKLVESGVLMKVQMGLKSGGLAMFLFHKDFAEGDPNAEVDGAEMGADAKAREFHKWRYAISDKLASVVNQTLVSEELIKMFDIPAKEKKSYKTARLYLIEKGFVEKIYVEDRPDHWLMCLRLITPYDPKKIPTNEKRVPAPGNDDDAEDSDATEVDSHLGDPKAERSADLMFGLWSDYQLFRFIADAGPAGIISQQLRRLLLNTTVKSLNTTLDRIASAKSAHISKVGEFIGKARSQRMSLTKAIKFQLLAKDEFPVMGEPSEEVQQPAEIATEPMMLEPTAVVTNNDEAPPASPSMPDSLPVKELILLGEKDSLTAAQRRKLLLEMVYQRKIVEFDASFTREFSQKFFDSSMLVDKKTMLRTVSQLESLGLVKKVTIQFDKSNGVAAKRLLILAKNVAVDSPEVKEFIERVQLSAEMKRSTKAQDRENRSVVGNMNIQRLQKPVHEKHAAELNADKDSQTRFFYLQKYGQIRSRVKRLQVFYDFIHSVALRSNRDGCDESTIGWFKTSSLLKALSLDVYLRVIGHSVETPELTEYLNSEESSIEIPIIELPEQLSRTIMSQSQRLRAVIAQMLETLAALGLLVEKEAVGSSPKIDRSLSVGLAYFVPGQVPLHNFQVAGFPVKFTTPMRTRTDFIEYWEMLQFNIVSPETLTSELPHALKGLQQPGTWNADWSITNEQREVLSAPLERQPARDIFLNTSMCRHMADRAGTTLTKVRAFYRNIMARHKEVVPKLQLRKVAEMENDDQPPSIRERLRKQQDDDFLDGRLMGLRARLPLVHSPEESSSDSEAALPPLPVPHSVHGVDEERA